MKTRFLSFFLVPMSLLVCLSSVGFTQDDGAYYYEKAVEQYANRAFPQALVFIDKALKEESDNATSIALKASILSKLRHHREALETIDLALSIEPDEFANYNSKGLIFSDMTLFDSAIFYCNIGLSLAQTKKDSADVLSNLGSSKRLKRDYQGSYDDLILAHNLAPESIGVLINLSITCSDVGRKDEVLPYLFKVIELDSTSVEAYANIGFTYQLDSLYAKSTEYYNKAAELQPRSPYIYSNRSFNKLKLGDLEGAMEDINYSIKLMYNNSWAYRNRALIYIEMGEKEKACKDLHTAVKYGYTRMYGDEVADLLKEHCE